MGVGGHFWDLLKPCARSEGPDFLRDRRVAVDLSFWIVQHDAAIRARVPHARKPYLRTTFFRTVALFSKMGAFPVFVVDGGPSPLKARARIERFFRSSGLDSSDLAMITGGEAGTPPKQRNQAFTRSVQECVELLELLGMPVLRANGEAEALCAQLNREGHVDACITADSDAFLFGAKCVIKCLRSNSNEPFECYNVSDVEACLGLKRKQMIAIALLVGNDHDLHGVPGFGVDTAVRFVKLFSEDEILDRLCEVGRGLLQGSIKSAEELNILSSDECHTKARSPHCSRCGHPGSKRDHLKSPCEFCITFRSENCMEKLAGFKCICSSCDKERLIKERKKHESWQIKLCERIAAVKNFPNNEIIVMYLNDNHGSYGENDGPLLKWDNPSVDHLVDYLAYHQHWDPSFTRQRLLSILSTFYLRQMASTLNEGLLYNQYEFHSIQRVKIRYGHPHYLVKWKRVANSMDSSTNTAEDSDLVQRESTEVTGSTDLFGEPDVPEVLIDDGCCSLVTEENMELVKAAFPREVDRFLEEKKLKEMTPEQRKSVPRPVSPGVQLSITEFYRSAKPLVQVKPAEDPGQNSQGGNRRKLADSDQKFSKSVRRRLLFD